MSRKTKALLMRTAVMTILVFWGLFEAYYDIYTELPEARQPLTGRVRVPGLRVQRCTRASLQWAWF